MSNANSLIQDLNLGIHVQILNEAINNYYDDNWYTKNVSKRQ